MFNDQKRREKKEEIIDKITSIGLTGYYFTRKEVFELESVIELFQAELKAHTENN